MSAAEGLRAIRSGANRLSMTGSFGCGSAALRYLLENMLIQVFYPEMRLATIDIPPGPLDSFEPPRGEEQNKTNPWNSHYDGYKEWGHARRCKLAATAAKLTHTPFAC